MMGAFWSGEDDTNERGRPLRLYSVYGKIMDEQHQYEIRIGMLGDFYKMDLDAVFEMPVERQTIKTREATIEDVEEVDGIIRKTTKNIHEEIILNEHGVDLPEFVEIDEVNEETGVHTTHIIDYSELDTKVYSEYSIKELEDGTSVETKVNRFPETWWNMYNQIGGISYTGYGQTTKYPQTSKESFLDISEDVNDFAVDLDLSILDDSDVNEDFDNFSSKTL